MSSENPQGFAAWLPDDGGPGVTWLDGQRASARERVKGQGVPTSKQEEWRYTSVKKLLDHGFLPVDEPVTALEPDDIEECLIPGLDSHRVVLVNGRYLPSLSELGDLPAGVRIGSLRQILENDPDALRERLNGVAGAMTPACSPPSTPPLWMTGSSC